MKKLKKSVCLVLSACLLISLMISPALAVTVVKRGSTGTAVRYVQYNLNFLGFSVGTVDGIAGTKTVAGIKSYQKSRGLAVDGVAGSATQGSLTSEVKYIQTLLKSKGYYTGSIDGIAGPNTISALKSFQTANGLSATGVANSATLSALENTNSASTLAIGSGNYNPGTLTQGSSYSISGTISSNYKITSVTVGVYKADGSATSYVKSATPNAASYNINKLDSSIKFGGLSGSSSGTTYYFKVTATDASGTTKTLVNNKFTVKQVTSAFTWPLSGNTYITSYFAGRVHPLTGKVHNHSGIDISAAKGTSVRAAGSGTAYVGCSTCTHNYSKSSSCGCGGGYGNYVYIIHANGLRTYYAHLTSVSIKNGASVTQGTVIGTVGSTGSSNGFHLHFEMRTGSSSSTRVDPLNYVTPQ